ncbi:MAG: DUF1499 domain-containing protein [Paracoccaceae bacterium]
MKRALRTMGLALAFAIIATLALMAYVRLAPVEATALNASPSVYAWDQGGAWNTVVPMQGGASLRLAASRGVPPSRVLAQLDAIALATPRTIRIAGSVADGRITWQTRSLIWGFPDYTTAEAREDGLYIYARLRFGRSDMGVNAARLQDWLAQL